MGALGKRASGVETRPALSASLGGTMASPISPSVLLSLLRLIPCAYEKAVEWTGKPGKEDKKKVREFVGLINERRVFLAPYNAEVVECVLGFLRVVLDTAAKTHAAITHPMSKQSVGVVLDDTRKFLDRWSRYTTPRSERLRPAWEHFDDQSELNKLLEFYADLGELRGKVKTAVQLLKEYADPTLAAPNLLDAADDESAARS